MSKIHQPLLELAKKILFRYTKFGAPSYPYNVEPIQLATFIMELERLRGISGNIAEIGVARGMTTRFICQHISNQALKNIITYYAIDTFESFRKEDLRYEVEVRGKSLFHLKGFEYNDQNAWELNFNQFPFVQTIKGDCASIDYSKISPLKLTFLDVDLYQPTVKTLPKIYEATVSGGVIIVDDVLDNSTYDGAYQAYVEFCSDYNLPTKIIGNKCGLIYKP